MKQILDKELANPASQLPFQDTLLLSNSTIMVFIVLDFSSWEPSMHNQKYLPTYSL